MKQSFVLTKTEDAEVEICSGYCEQVRHVGEDGISVCDNCGVVEGYTYRVTEIEYERLNP